MTKQTAKKDKIKLDRKQNTTETANCIWHFRPTNV